jgi:hypothetical protein
VAVVLFSVKDGFGSYNITDYLIANLEVFRFPPQLMPQGPSLAFRFLD